MLEKMVCPRDCQAGIIPSMHAEDEEAGVRIVRWSEGLAATFFDHMPSEERDFNLVHMINIPLVKDSDGRVLLSVVDSPAYLKDLGNKTWFTAKMNS